MAMPPGPIAIPGSAKENAPVAGPGNVITRHWKGAPAWVANGVAAAAAARERAMATRDHDVWPAAMGFMLGLAARVPKPGGSGSSPAGGVVGQPTGTAGVWC